VHFVTPVLLILLTNTYLFTTAIIRADVKHAPRTIKAVRYE